MKKQHIQVENKEMPIAVLLQDPAFLIYLGAHPTMPVDEAYQAYQEMLDQKYVDMHLENRRITKQADGFWHTRITEPDGTVTQIKKKSYRDLCKVIVSYYKNADDLPIVSRVFHEMADERLSYNEIQQGTYDRMVTDFNRFFVARGMDKRVISTISEDELTKFIKDCIAEHHLSQKAWANLKGLIVMVFGYAKTKRYTKFSISAFFGDLHLPRNIFKKRIVDDRSQVFTDEEMQKIEEWIRGSKERLRTPSNLGILLAFYTGLRAGELSALKWEDLEGNKLTVRRTEIRYRNPITHQYEFEVREFTKGRDGIRTIYLPLEALDIVDLIREVNPDGEYFFMEGDERKKGDRFSEKLKRICKYVGIPPRSLHKLRKTYASILLDAGCTEKLVMQQMGHADILTTKQFYYRNRHNDDENAASINKAFENYRGAR